MKRKLLLGVGLAVILTLAGCGGSIKSSSTEDTQTNKHYPLTIKNYKKAEGGTTWEKKE